MVLTILFATTLNAYRLSDLHRQNDDGDEMKEFKERFVIQQLDPSVIKAAGLKRGIMIFKDFLKTDPSLYRRPGLIRLK